ncbi:MAG: TOBE domain-containing protein [Desulfobacterales bacterium]
MRKKKPIKEADNQASKLTTIPERSYHGQIFSSPDTEKSLDAIQLYRLEKSFRDWTNSAVRIDVRRARLRILLIFLLIRYTGGKLSEVLGIDPHQDIDFERHFVHLGRIHKKSGRLQRKVHMSESLCSEIQEIINDLSSQNALQKMLSVDPGFVRRKFYERAEACGISKQLGAPEILRKSRAVELMQNNMPLPAVQMILGHSTPNLTSSYVSFSEDDIQQVTRLFIEREASRKTSARNSFFGKIQTLRRGDIQTGITLRTISGYSITTVITNDSLEQLALKTGSLITAEVKAPWVILHAGKEEPKCSAENRFKGVIERVKKGKVNTEYILRIPDGTTICSIVSTESAQNLSLDLNDQAWAVFNCFAVVINVQ